MSERGPQNRTEAPSKLNPAVEKPNSLIEWNNGEVTLSYIGAMDMFEVFPNPGRKLDYSTMENGGDVVYMAQLEEAALKTLPNPNSQWRRRLSDSLDKKLEAMKKFTTDADKIRARARGVDLNSIPGPHNSH